jgi:hypothetical protein
VVTVAGAAVMNAVVAHPFAAAVVSETGIAVSRFASPDLDFIHQDE